MPRTTTLAEYRALASLRYLIRKFVGEGDDAARRAGLEPQQYQLLLAIGGLPEGMPATVHVLAERLALKHNSTVELINRMEKHRYVYRKGSPDDRRCVLVGLLPRGERLLEEVASQRLGELRAEGTSLVKAMDSLLGHKRPLRRKMTSTKGTFIREARVKDKRAGQIRTGGHQ